MEIAVAEAIQLALEYDPQPPFDAGSPAKVPGELVEAIRGASRFAVDGIPGHAG